MSRFLLTMVLAGSAGAAAAQVDPHAGHVMPADPHAGHAAPADPHAGHAMTAAPAARTGASLAVGDAPAAAPITDALADAIHGRTAMDAARATLAREHGGARVSKVQADLLEWAPQGEGYRWDVEAWFGGDLNRLVVKTEGEGGSRQGLRAAAVQALYSRAVARYADAQVGVRYDVEPRSRAYLVAGVDAMLPYWFEAEGAVFLSDRGDLLARATGSYDFRLAQRLVLQPRAEVTFAAQDIADLAIGSGLSSGEFGLRLRYEIRRTFAPYVGVSYERAFGATADLARAKGDGVGETRFVAGLRAWF
ncbi:copper resistance protein B [Phenylobacterium immobile]|uniref:copper resistance protein B n=1 Tax=Phenylobacterium immobile TaxID=21 RepID=UPI000A626E14|nr:copper resistance protein B [Phenylobacterium immobile]